MINPKNKLVHIYVRQIMHVKLDNILHYYTNGSRIKQTKKIQEIKLCGTILKENFVFDQIEMTVYWYKNKLYAVHSEYYSGSVYELIKLK